MGDICRLCLFEIASSDGAVYKDDVVKEAKIKAVIPDIDLGMTTSLTLCNSCIRLLNTAHDFICACIKTEENLKHYLKQHRLNTPLDLKTYKKCKADNLTQITKEIEEDEKNSVEMDDTIQDQFDEDTSDSFKNPLYDNEDYVKEEKITNKCNDGDTSSSSASARHHGDTSNSSTNALHYGDTSNSSTSAPHHGDTSNSSTSASHSNECNVKEGKVMHRCTECGDGFLLARELRRHFTEHMLTKPYKCQHCKKLFTTVSDLRIHLQVHSCVASRFKCDICNKGFSRTYDLRIHMKTHSNSRRICHFCGTSFNDRVALKEHTRNVHKKIPCICETCGLPCKSKTNLIEHIRTHTGERPYRCELCGKGFAQRSTLTTHQKSVHETGVPYVCTICGRACRVKGNLTKHMLVHMEKSAQKPISCTFENCGRIFYNIKGRSRHMLRHGEKKVVCHLCGKTFFENAGLKRHMLIHTGEKPYECEICRKTFNQYHNLKVHLKSHGTKLKNMERSNQNVNSYY